MEHVKLLRSRFDHDRVVPATISVESERLAPGRDVQRSAFVRLALSVTGEHRLESVAARLRQSGFSCEFQANEKTILWSKLAFLASFALTGTASDKDE
jgi:2-dehydropantoate 2-reductase